MLNEGANTLRAASSAMSRVATIGIGTSGRVAPDCANRLTGGEKGFNDAGADISGRP